MSINPVYGVSESEDRQLSTDEELYEVVNLPATIKTSNEKQFTRPAQGEIRNANSRNASLAIGIALSTAVLALVVALVSVGLSTALNSNSEIQFHTEVVSNLQLSLNQSVNTLEDLDQQISSLEMNKAMQCDVLNQTVNSIQDTIREQSDLQNKIQQQIAKIHPTSCSEIPTDRPSGEYWILRNSSSVQVYCDMNRTCCNTTGGWMKVANLDMTNSNQKCPDGFQLHNESMAPLRTCGRPETSGCVSTTFPVHGIQYSRVCGRVLGYQFGTTDAFLRYYDEHAMTIHDNYVDGVSLTNGKLPRKHIWTFAAAQDEVSTRGRLTCPCTLSDIPYTGVVPPFIGQDYFCNTGSRNHYQGILYSDDPLWNGQGCGGTSTCCSFNNPPWFCKQLPQPTTDDIELKLCLSNVISDENILLEQVDIFVQ